MKNAKRLMTWLAINICLGVLLWSGFDQGVEGARNCAYFVLWIRIAISPFVLTDASIESLRKDGPGLVPDVVRALVDGSIVGFLAWHGAWATAVGLLVSCACIGAARSAAYKPAGKVSA